MRRTFGHAIVSLVDDEDAILSRRNLLIAGALSLVAPRALAQPMPCLAPPPADPPASFSRAPGRIDTPLERIPEVVRNHLEHLTIYIAGGGMSSTPWRVKLSLWGTLWGAEGDQHGGPSWGRLEREWTTGLLAPQLRELVAIADRVWRERVRPPSDPTTSYGEVIAMRDGSEAFFRDGYGPIQSGAGRELIARLRELANRARPR